MKRRSFIKQAVLAAAGAASLSNQPLAAVGDGEAAGQAPTGLEAVRARDWLARWEKNILSNARNRYCDRELGEEIGWLISPFLDGFFWMFKRLDGGEPDARWKDSPGVLWTALVP